MAEAANVIIGQANKDGLYLAAEGTALPASASAALTSFTSVGYISEDGVKIGMDTNSEDLFVWQSIAPIRTLITQRTITLGFTMVETSPDTLALYFDTAKPTGIDTFSLDIPEQPAGIVRAAVIDVKDGDKQLRFCLARTVLSEADEITINRGELVGYPVTLKVLASPDNKIHVAHTITTATRSLAPAGVGE